MRSNLLLHLALSLVTLLLCLLPTSVSSAQENNNKPLEIQLAIDRKTLEVNESTQATLILHNTTAYTLTNVSAELQGVAFKVLNSTSLPNSLPPHVSAQANYVLQSQISGSHNAIFIVQYSWDDLATGITYQQLEIASVDEIEVTDPWAFDWPDYLIPLLIGLMVGQFGAWLNDWWKQHQTKRQQEEQARGITLAVLQAARRGVEAKGPISFDMWDEAIVKGNLYPALHQLGRTIGKPELSKRLAELSITLADYNERQANGQLTEDKVNALIDELADLIRMIENRS